MNLIDWVDDVLSGISITGRLGDCMSYTCTNITSTTTTEDCYTDRLNDRTLVEKGGHRAARI
jgi:hypothetical protein